MSALHDFDLLLCRHVRDNVYWNRADKDVAERLRTLDPRLSSFLTDDPPPTAGEDWGPKLLLTDEELSALAFALDHLPKRSEKDWLPLQGIYERSTLCTGEILRRLAPAEGRRWATESERFKRKLTAHTIELHEGIEIVAEWVRKLRRYLEAMRALTLIPPPVGSFPTPTNPSPTLPEEAEVDTDNLSDLERMRRAISTHPKRSNAPAPALVKLAGINRQRGYKALRELAAIGEYKGFQKSKATEPSNGSS